MGSFRWLAMKLTPEEEKVSRKLSDEVVSIILKQLKKKENSTE